MDVASALLLVPVAIVVGLVLVAANPLFNRGPLLFCQVRMGRHGSRFTIVKFRTMRPAATNGRPVGAPVEVHRITALGRILRRMRLDELPQAFNILHGEMSIVGPRPDIYEHAVALLEMCPIYRHRLEVKPGLTGLAQVFGGYAADPSEMRRKARLDAIYVRRACWRLDVNILLRTIWIVATGFGSR